jgi:hypothetical protein
MAIHRNTHMQAYQLKAGGTRARMAILRMIAIDIATNARVIRPTWRTARDTTITEYESYFGMMSQGRNDGETAWYSHCGEYFRCEVTCAALLRQDYRGYYADDYGTIISGFVACLPHGRFIAGYENSDTGERVYYGHIYDDEYECARMADEHAREALQVAVIHAEQFKDID